MPSTYLTSILTALVVLATGDGFLFGQKPSAFGRGGLAPRSQTHPVKEAPSIFHMGLGTGDNDASIEKLVKSSLFTLGLLAATWMPLPASIATPLGPQVAGAASDPSNIVSCLFQKCRVPLAKCIANPMCLANVVCINTCNGKSDEIGCQIKCGDIFENSVVGEFNNCAVSQMSCVPQKQDEGLYPIPPAENLVPQFNTKLFRGRWYITAGQNPLFDIFPCQVHFFTEPEPGTFFGQLNWRVENPDGEFFTRDALQRFVQDPQQPAHLINHDNEYLHYKDDWYILDFEYDNNKDGVPPFAFVYYRGSNDAWDGYGGAVIYTRDSKLPESLRPRLQAAAKKVNMDFDKDFTLTDNSCPVDMSPEEKLLLREKFLGEALLQTEKQVQVQATKARGNAVNLIKTEEKQAEKALEEFSKLTSEFENEVIKDAELIEKELEKDIGIVKTEIVNDLNVLLNGDKKK